MVADLHLLRRWFIARARDALNQGATGFTMFTVAEVCGHAKGGLGLSMTSRYAGAGDDGGPGGLRKGGQAAALVVEARR
jgi:hypothetical protein